MTFARLMDWARYHFDSLRRAIFGAPLWIWPVPFVVAAIILVSLLTPFDWVTSKDVQEIVAPTVLGVLLPSAWAVHRWVRQTFSLMLACFVTALFLRELHFQGTSNGFYLALIALSWWASSKREEILPYLRHPGVGGLLACAIWTYAITKVLDRHYLIFLPNYWAWNDHVEETLETLGHSMVFGAVLVTLRLGTLMAARPEADAAARQPAPAA